MPIPPKRNPMVRNVILIAGAIVALPFVFAGVNAFIAMDPFAAFRDSENAEEQPVSVDLDNVNMRHYRGGKLVTKAKADRVKVSSNRSEFTMEGVSDGVYNGEKGSIQFAAKTATVNAPQKSVLIQDGVKVKGKDFDLATKSVRFTDSTSVLETKDSIKGKLYDGDVKATGFKYNTKTEAFVVGKTVWQGNLKFSLQDAGDTQRPTRWNIQGDNTHNDPKTNQMITDRGRATDGEIIVFSDKIVWDRKADIVTCTGNVRYFSPESNCTAAKVVIFRKEKRAVMTEKVRMLVKPEAEQNQPAKEEPIPQFKLLVADEVKADMIAYPKNAEEKKKVDELRSSESMKKYPSQIAADYIEYWYGKGNRHAIIKGNPQARQDFTSGMWRHVWTDHALYDGEKDLLTLVSGDKDLARMKNSYGDDGTAKTFILSTKADDEEFSGTNMQGTFMSTEEDERGNKTPPPVTTGGGAAPKKKV